MRISVKDIGGRPASGRQSPIRHADYRFLGKPDEGMQKLLMELLKKDPRRIEFETRKRPHASFHCATRGR